MDSLMAQKYTDVCEGITDSSVRAKFLIFDLETLYPSATSPLVVIPALTNKSASAHTPGLVDTSIYCCDYQSGDI